MQAEALGLCVAHSLSVPTPKSWYVNKIPKSIAEKIKIPNTFGNFLVSKYILPTNRQDNKIQQEELLAKKYLAILGFIGNTDALKMPGDNNFIHGTDGSYFIDWGSNCFFHALGASKKLEDYTQVTEIDSLRDPRYNNYAAIIFKGVSPQEIKKQVIELQQKAAIADRYLAEMLHYLHIGPVLG